MDMTQHRNKPLRLGTGGLTMASCKGRVCLGRENICKNCIKEDVCKIAEISINRQFMECILKIVITSKTATDL